MSILDRSMRRLAIQTSAHFEINHPEYYIHPEGEALDAVEFVVDDAEEALRRGATETGLRLSCWAPFLLAAAIGYDGFIVETLGETFASHLKTSVTEHAGADDIRVGEELGIHKPEQYLTAGNASERAVDLWWQALHQAGHGSRPFGLELAFWASCTRATDFGTVAADFATPVVAAAASFRSFAAG
ncbi:hypothetical protein AB0O65_08345 [Microbacterium sp. NPDC077391]|uniref:hypothetical protein n=1 Tax=Microbacterium sp. NPDC077391 TaxID=3154765 RepID=UPI00341618EB